MEHDSNEERDIAASAVTTRIEQQMKQYKVKRANDSIRTTLPERQEAAKRRRFVDVRSLFYVSHQHIWDALARWGALQEVLGDLFEKRIRCKTKINAALFETARANDNCVRDKGFASYVIIHRQWHASIIVAVYVALAKTAEDTDQDTDLYSIQIHSTREHVK